jgi:hypothetical protein
MALLELGEQWFQHIRVLDVAVSDQQPRTFARFLPVEPDPALAFYERHRRSLPCPASVASAASDGGGREVRVIDCNECGETIKAASDEELARQLSEHMKSEHSDVEWDDEQASQSVSDQAYTATDS